MTADAPAPWAITFFKAWVAFGLESQSAQLNALRQVAASGTGLLTAPSPAALAHWGSQAVKAQQRASRTTVAAGSELVRGSYHALVRAQLLERSLLQSHAVEKAVQAGQASALNLVDRTARLLTA